MSKIKYYGYGAHEEYCKYCGSKLISKELPCNEFDTITGEKITKIHKKCPKVIDFLTMQFGCKEPHGVF